MPYICPICQLQPFSHSLIKLFEKKDILYYYTCPAQAIRYNDLEGIINHYNGILSEIPENKEWIWIFDSLGFTMKHAAQTNIAISIVKLISNKFSKHLKKIIIINPTAYITITHTILLPFLNTKIRNIIEINYEDTKPEEIIFKTKI